MAYEKPSVMYLNEEREKLWFELRHTQRETKDLFSLINTIKTEIADISKSIPDEVKSAKSNAGLVTRYKNQSATSRDEIASILERIQSYEKSCIEISEAANKTLSDTVQNCNNANYKASEINEHYQHITSINEHFENIDAIIERIENLDAHSNEIKIIKEKSSQALSNIQKHHKEVKELYNSIFGYSYTDEESLEIQTITGLKHELEKSYLDIKKDIESAEKSLLELTTSSKSQTEDSILHNSNLINEKILGWQKEHDDILTTIRSLLPAALTAGLSVAFSDKKDVELEEQKTLTKKFSDAIKFLSCISLLPVFTSFYFISESGIEKAINVLPQLVSAVLPIYIPVLWLAYSLNKRLNLSKRLVEEYTHKEVLSKTFEGLSSQIDKIDNNEISKELRIKLLYNLLSVSSENPGKLISDYNKTDHPILDVLEKSSKLTDALETVAKIPGMGAISKFLNEKADQLLADENKKVEDGLSKVKPGNNITDIRNDNA